MTKKLNKGKAVVYGDIIAVHPGVFIKSLMEYTNATIQQLSKFIEFDESKLSEFINGQTDLTITLAEKLSQCFGISVEFLFKQQMIYNEKIEEMKKLGAVFNE